MPIRYIHNDSASVPYLETVTAARKPRTGQRARFDVNLPSEDVYGLGTSEFVDRQCYEAALRTLEVWESVSAPFRFWHNGQRIIRLKQRRETGFGASYDRVSIGFDFHPLNHPKIFVGASVDAVSHEIGHAILDAIRPELWDSFFAEVAAFHEGFSDCISLLVALADDTILSALFALSPQAAEVLTVSNNTSQVAESVAKYCKSLHGPQNANSVPRRLRNKFQWAIPSILPANPSPNRLSSEPHSFGQVFSGCFYDCINNIYLNNKILTKEGLLGAAKTAGGILTSAISSAPEEVRFFRSVGKTMIQADRDLNGGINHVQISHAFNSHNVQLGSAALLAATISLNGPAPTSSERVSRRLNARTRNDLVKKIGMGQGTKVSTSVIRVGNSSVVRAKVRQKIDVGVKVSDGSAIILRAQTAQDVMLGEQHGQCVVLGDIPNNYTAEEEVNSFVQSLAENGEIFSITKDLPATHKIQKRGKQQILRRVRFSCCHRN
ncbi:MAG: hypothetical protein ACJASL_002897 [Paraglaciecola sp.]|jgi:hypothetical protein